MEKPPTLNCANCGGELPAGANFCRHCGAAVEDSRADAAESPAADTGAPAAGESASADLQRTVQLLQAEVARLSERVGVLEALLSQATAGARPAQPRQSPQAPQTPAATAQPAAPVVPAGSGGAGGSTPASFPASLFSRDWEWLLGGNWLARIGILALIVGVGFFLRLAFDNDWIGETGRVILGLIVGLALLGGGEYWTRKYPVWAQAVTGGGIAILYLSTYAAYALYGLIPALAALGFSALVTLAAAGLALRYEARAIAVLGILGGFATPLFLAGKLPGEWALLAYVLLLDLGVLALATFRNWRWFTLLALLGSLFLFGFWNAELQPGLALAQAGITVIFLIFVGATTLFHLLWQRPLRPLDQTLIALNGLAYLVISYLLLFEDYREWMGGFTLLLALFYGLLGYGILARHREQVHLSLFALALALVFLTIAVPVQLNGLWVPLAWAVEAVVLFRLSFLEGMHQLRWAGLALLALLLFRLVIYDGPISNWGNIYLAEGSRYWPILNWRFLAFGAGIAALYGSAWFVGRWRGRLVYRWEGWLLPVLLGAASGLTLLALSIEVVATVEQEVIAIAPGMAGNVISLSLSVLWAVYAAALIVLGIVRRNRWLRLSGLGLLAVPIVKLFAYDAFELEQGYRVAAFIGLGALLVLGGFLYQRYSRVIRGFLLE